MKIPSVAFPVLLWCLLSACHSVGHSSCGHCNLVPDERVLEALRARLTLAEALRDEMEKQFSYVETLYEGGRLSPADLGPELERLHRSRMRVLRCRVELYRAEAMLGSSEE